MESPHRPALPHKCSPNGKLQFVARSATPTPPSADALLGAIDLARLRVSQQLDPERRALLGQFMTPGDIARQLAGMLLVSGGEVRILDAGAGIGSLGAAVVAQLIAQEPSPAQISLTAYELEGEMQAGLRQTMEGLAEICDSVGVTFKADVRQNDFLLTAVNQLDGDLFRHAPEGFDIVVMNPPYRKINARSAERELCRRIGLETSNLYTAFLAVAARLLHPDGQMVAIVPRSFTNGTYFIPFRKLFTDMMVFRRLHVYESRDRAFLDDSVLQENVIFHAVKSRDIPKAVIVTSSSDPADLDHSYRDVSYEELIRPDDPTRVIHIVPDELNRRVAQRMGSLAAGLSDLKLEVSTGRVVDFRATEYVRKDWEPGCVPLIYPGHIRGGQVVWPLPLGRKPNALVCSSDSVGLLVPEGLYVLTKRFTAKEEPRRIVAALYEPSDVASGPVGLENHLNYFHCAGKGLDRPIALGLRAFLNSTLVDLFFRQFSGHTQVNAGDLRRLRYPSEEQLRSLGARVGEAPHTQDELDSILDEELFSAREREVDPVTVRHRVDEALEVLRALGVSRQQVSERTALTLLALADLGPADPWSEAAGPTRTIAAVMDYIRDAYGKTYSPNTREAVRKHILQGLADVNIVMRCEKSGTAAPPASYQVDTEFLALLRTFGTTDWADKLHAYITARRRADVRLTGRVRASSFGLAPSDEVQFTLSDGAQPKMLIDRILQDFCPRWTPEGVVIYAVDSSNRPPHFDRDALHDLGLAIEDRMKLPDVIIHDRHHDWLVLVEAFVKGDAINDARRQQLAILFADSTAPLVYVTAFLDRHAMIRSLPEIAWETEVWCASDPEHLIHFNGDRYLGPYST
jgi:adenine-specific DNA-methyltransferase